MIGNRSNGYTLIELIIAFGIFALVATAALGAHLAVYRVEQRAVAKERLEAASRNILDTITQEFQLGQINYQPDIHPVDNPSFVLNIINSRGEEIVMRWEESSQTLWYQKNDQDEQRITPENIAVESAKFYAFPLARDSSEQQRVTALIVLATAESGASGGILELPVQMTISSRSNE